MRGVSYTAKVTNGLGDGESEEPALELFELALKRNGSRLDFYCELGLNTS